jgi:hypothetical protein
MMSCTLCPLPCPRTCTTSAQCLQTCAPHCHCRDILGVVLLCSFSANNLNLLNIPLGVHDQILGDGLHRTCAAMPAAATQQCTDMFLSQNSSFGPGKATVYDVHICSRRVPWQQASAALAAWQLASCTAAQMYSQQSRYRCRGESVDG